MRKKDFYLVKYSTLKKILELILIKKGTPKQSAKLVSALLAKSDLSGQNSHGSARLNFYLDKIDKKKFYQTLKLKL